MKKENELLPVTRAERRLLIVKSIGIVILLDYFFYQSLWALVPLSAVGYLY